MEDVCTATGQHNILAPSGTTDERTRVIKDGESFGVYDRHGDIRQEGLGEQGLYCEGTRFLSLLELALNGVRPVLLSSGVAANNILLTVDLANPDLCPSGDLAVPRETVHLFRSKLIFSGTAYDHLRLTNFNDAPFDYAITLRYSADFRDLFEVRGSRRSRRGRVLAPRAEDGLVVLAYEGLDGVLRETRIRCTPRPASMTGEGIVLKGRLPARGQTEATVSFSCRVHSSAKSPVRLSYHQALDSSTTALARLRSGECQIKTSNEHFNELLDRSTADLAMMVTHTDSGLYPYAGVPWYSTPFGRDGIITALQTLWFNPDIARGALAFLAANQAREIDPESDAEPGKILHELRDGEMAILGEIPFRRYYGSIDSTPLFVLLASEHFRRTNDLDFARGLWPSVEQGLAWIDDYGDLDGDGFVEYARKTEAGLINQGWKDSYDSVRHADGSLAEGPIALCEVQAYVYGAQKGAADLAWALGLEDRARELERRAEDLRRRFEAVFWDDGLGMYSLALDGNKRPCLVRSSNAGHCLLTGIASLDRATRMVELLMGEDMYSGWGIRTIAGSASFYNPMSYHNGSVWPHDNSLIGQGMARYGFGNASARVLSGLLDASLSFDLHRLPELFCGFKRRPGEGPTSYPVACAPQAWASGAPVLLLQACAGLSINARDRVVRFFQPALPPFLDQVAISGLKVADAEVSLVIRRHDSDVSVFVTRRKGRLDVVVIK